MIQENKLAIYSETLQTISIKFRLFKEKNTLNKNCISFRKTSVRKIEFSLLHVVQTGCGAHTASYPRGIGSCFPGDRVDVA
jgi:hypothetical protein